MSNLNNRSFLKYAGSKFRSLDYLFQYLPKSGDILIEPFVGSATLFLNTDYKRYYLNDLNSDLISVYKFLQEDQKNFIQYLHDVFDCMKNDQETFLENREMFNDCQNPLLKAALYVWINRAGYNGLMRYNKKGKLNTPYGWYKKIYFPEKELLFFSEKLKQCEVIFTSMNYYPYLNGEHFSNGSVIYCDPPYQPESKTANYTEFWGTIFDETSHALLASIAQGLPCNQNDIKVFINNRDNEITRNFYKNACNIYSYTLGSTMHRGKRFESKELLAVYENQML